MKKVLSLCMDIQASKIELTKIILNIENPDIINKIRHLLLSESDDLWLSLSQSEKEEIQFGINQLEKGERISIDEFFDKVL